MCIVDRMDIPRTCTGTGDLLYSACATGTPINTRFCHSCHRPSSPRTSHIALRMKPSSSIRSSVRRIVATGNHIGTQWCLFVRKNSKLSIPTPGLPCDGDKAADLRIQFDLYSSLLVYELQRQGSRCCICKYQRRRTCGSDFRPRGCHC